MYIIEPYVKDELQEILYSNYSVIRNELCARYNKLCDNLDSNHLFHNELMKNFLDSVRSYVVEYIAKNTVHDVDSITLYVQDVFTMDNIIRIIENGDV